MGNVVKRAVVAVGKFIAKSATTAAGSFIPVVGPALASHVNSLYAEGGAVSKLAGVSAPIPTGFKAQTINTPEQLIAMINKAPEVAAKAGLTVEKVRDAMEKAKSGEVPMKKRGGMMKKKGGDMAMVHSGGGGEGIGSFAKGGRVLSVF
jgi:hypothetical protein